MSAEVQTTVTGEKVVLIRWEEDRLSVESPEVTLAMREGCRIVWSRQGHGPAREIDRDLVSTLLERLNRYREAYRNSDSAAVGFTRFLDWTMLP